MFGPYVVAEFVDGWQREQVEHDLWPLLTESDVVARFPDALAAWRRRDDSTGERTAGMLRELWAIGDG